VTEITDLLAVLKAFYPRQELDPRTLEVYEHALEDIPLEALTAAIRSLTRTERFFPTVAEIRLRCAEQALGTKTATEAWLAVQARLSDRFAPLTPLEQLALEFIGGAFTVRRETNVPTVRAQFLKAYREIREDRIRAGVERPDFPSLQEAGTMRPIETSGQA
jgi:hypothetical protein